MLFFKFWLFYLPWKLPFLKKEGKLLYKVKFTLQFLGNFHRNWHLDYVDFIFEFFCVKLVKLLQ